MIIPNTPPYNAKSDAEFRIGMIAEIKKHYKDILGPDIKLLDLPNGLEIIQAKVQQRLFEVSQGQIDLRQAEVRSMAA